MLKDNRKKKARILDKATDAFLDSIARVERAIWGRVKDIIGNLSTTGGKVDSSPENEALLFSMDQDIIGVATGNLNGGISAYLENFDKVEKLNRLIYGGFLSDAEAVKVARLTFPQERTFLADEVTRSLTEPAIIRANVVQPIRRLLFSAITFREPISKLQANLRAEILSRDGSSSRLLRYTRQISQDAISRFDGAINDKIRDEVGLDGFFYIGSVIKTTRSNCRELVNGAGKFADLAISPGLYAVKDLPKIVRRGRGRSGWNDNTTAETFAQYRGGYGCRHEVLYVLLSDEESQRRLSRQLAA